MKTGMSDAARQKANEYQRNWKRKNPDKVRQHNVNYWERKAKEPETIEAQVFNLHHQGKSLRDIGLAVGISHMKVKRILQNVT